MSVPSPENDLYVNYLPVPTRVRRFVRAAAPAIVLLMVGVGVVASVSQRSSGSAVWDDATTRVLSGMVVAKPYPMLWVSDAGDGTPGFVLLVEQGKHGAARAAAFDAKPASVTGFVLRREGRMMLELAAGEDAIRTPEPSQAVGTPPGFGERTETTLRGEIVDAKCYLGAMKPGTGKTHKECAALCVRGGIPAMFVVRTADGSTKALLLESAEGGAIDHGILPFIGDPVEIRGRVRERGGLRFLSLSSGGLSRM